MYVSICIYIYVYVSIYMYLYCCLYEVQGIIQALLLTSVFPERLSFIAVSYNPGCVSTLALSARGSSSWKIWLCQQS